LTVVALAAAVVVGITAASCGPQQKFCPDSGDGVCRPVPDAAVDTGVDLPAMEACSSTSFLADGAMICNP
jgi:hypothetical protein